MSYQRRPVGSASIVGSPAKSCGKKPMLSEWSATTRKSSGRESFTRWPLEAVISSPLREAVGVPRAEPGAERAGVHRERRVQVRVAEERARREVAARVGRVGRLRGKCLLDRLLVERADVGGDLRRWAARHRADRHASTGARAADSCRDHREVSFVGYRPSTADTRSANQNIAIAADGVERRGAGPRRRAEVECTPGQAEREDGRDEERAGRPRRRR